MSKLKLAITILLIGCFISGALYAHKLNKEAKYEKALLLSAHSLGYKETKLLSLDTLGDGFNVDRLEILYTTDLSLDQFTALVNGSGYKTREYFDTKVDNFFPGPKTARGVSNNLEISNSSYPQNTHWVIIDPLTGNNIDVEYFELTSGSWNYDNQKVEGNLVLLSINRMSLFSLRDIFPTQNK